MKNVNVTLMKQNTEFKITIKFIYELTGNIILNSYQHFLCISRFILIYNFKGVAVPNISYIANCLFVVKLFT